MKKKLLIGIGIVIVLVVAAAVALHVAVDASGFRKLVEDRAGAALGHPVSVGDLRFSIVPVLGLEADDVVVAARPGQGAATVASLKRLRIGARLLPLLRGRLEVTRIVLVEPSVDIARDAHGNWNFDVGGAGGSGGPAPGPSFTVGELRVVRGRLHVRDASRSASAPLEVTLDDLDLTASGLGSDTSRVEISSGHVVVNDAALVPVPLAVDIAAARLDVEGAGKKIELSKLNLQAGHTTFAVSGDVAEQARGRRVDLELAPTSVATADLGALLARLTGDRPVTLSGKPISVEGGVHGLLAAGQLPAVKARVVVDGITLETAALTQPLADVHAVATFDGSELAVDKLGARVGGTDISGGLRLELEPHPTLHFDLSSQHADVDELMGLPATKESEQGPSSASSLIAGAVADGTVRVADGTVANFQFQDLSAQLHLEHGVATLDPVTTKLYGGGFQGRLESDLTRSPQTFEVTGSVNGVEVGTFTAAATGTRNLLEGRASGRFSARGAGTDPQAILADLEGKGTAEIVDGQLGRLDILGEIGKVVGVLGQQTLAKLAEGAAPDATRFSRLATTFTVAGGRMQLERVVLLSPTFDLTGSGALDLEHALIKGRFDIAFSPQVSGWMKQDGSRAAALFWDQGSGRITLPVQLDGPLNHPGATVDWGATVRDLARRPVQRELGNLLGNFLGQTPGNEATSGPHPSPSTPSGGPPATNEEPPASSRPSGTRAQSPSGKLALEVAKTQWRGSFLAKDFTIQLEVRGSAAERVVMRAVDSAGREVQERTVDLAGRMGGGTTSLELRIDGKRLLIAARPVTVTITATGGGETAALTLQIPAAGR